ncbi:polyhydroxyalkanoic acid system family protein [Polaromonas sp.]|uniref:polyhydroxyalkanoic acid system family protein n=1 Tax=Polaromonas sp. TaxID=1869339 RepID=UPI00286CC0BC|nr:polyhydroxyalkanoic acid system family protein [Polaromonas sp.]
MADIHIERKHSLGLAKARKVAFQWAEQVEEEFDMECIYAEGSEADEVSFKRSGVAGTLVVTPNSFDLRAKLGFLLGVFKEKIEGEIVKNLDTLLAKSASAPTAKKTTARKKA